MNRNENITSPTTELELHDWEIDGVSVDWKSANVTLRVRSPHGDESKELKFSDVTHFNANGMRMQNVILDVMIFESESNSDYYAHCRRILSIEREPTSDMDDKKLFYIEPSIGLELAVRFSTLRVCSVPT